MIFHFTWFHIFSTKSRKLMRFSCAQTLTYVCSTWATMIIMTWPSEAHDNTFLTAAHLHRRKCFASTKERILSAISRFWLCQNIRHWSRESMISFAMHSKGDCLWNGIVTINGGRNVSNVKRHQKHLHWKSMPLALFSFWELAAPCPLWPFALNFLSNGKWTWGLECYGLCVKDSLMVIGTCGRTYQRN